ncbi:MAG: hypothetical protein JKY48_02615 [Flavobacteriales bacterium]|nr:hypothetical protein [Flavobacteriales bacterium]
MDQNKLELFEKYLLMKLAESDQLLFEERLKTDTVFSQEYESFIAVRDSLIHSNNERLKNKIKIVLQEDNLQVVHRKVPKIYYVAASVLLICMFSLYSYWDYSKSDSLYSEYFSPYSETSSVLGSQKSPLDICLNEYNKEAYKKSIECLTKLPVNSDKYFYLGMSYTNLDDTDQAIKALIKVEELASSFLEESNWYLTSLYLKQDDLSHVKKRLNTILNNPNSNYKKTSAKKLLLEI